MPRLAQCWFWAVTIWRWDATRVAVIRLTHAHSMTIDEIDRAARALAVQLKERYGVESEWLPDRIVLIGSGVSGFLQVASDHLVDRGAAGSGVEFTEARHRARNHRLPADARYVRLRSVILAAQWLNSVSNPSLHKSDRIRVRHDPMPRFSKVSAPLNHGTPVALSHGWVEVFKIAPVGNLGVG